MRTQCRSGGRRIGVNRESIRPTLGYVLRGHISSPLQKSLNISWLSALANCCAYLLVMLEHLGSHPDSLWSDLRVDMRMRIILNNCAMSKVQSRLFPGRLVPPSFRRLRFKVALSARTHSFRRRIRLLIAIFHLSGFALAASRGEGLSSEATAQASTRYGLFDLLDHRSAYSEGVFPEPFLVDDTSLEVNEARLDWLHTRANDQHDDLARAEVEKGFGLLTLELEVPFERDLAADTVSEGVGNISFGARYPVYQVVSGNGFADCTFGAAMEIGIPVNSSVSKNTETVPKMFNDLRLGDHFTLQSIVGFSTLFGGGAEGGLQTFEYGFVFGYTIQHRELPLPAVQQLIPVFELDGETELNKGDAGHTSLLGNLGFRANLKTVGSVQPRLGFGFVFPINRGAHEDTHWGVITSLVFEY